MVCQSTSLLRDRAFIALCRPCIVIGHQRIRYKFSTLYTAGKTTSSHDECYSREKPGGRAEENFGSCETETTHMPDMQVFDPHTGDSRYGLPARSDGR